MAPPEHARWLDENLPDARLVIWEGEGHLLAFAHLAEMLRELLTYHSGLWRCRFLRGGLPGAWRGRSIAPQWPVSTALARCSQRHQCRLWGGEHDAPDHEHRDHQGPDRSAAPPGKPRWYGAGREGESPDAAATPPAPGVRRASALARGAPAGHLRSSGAQGGAIPGRGAGRDCPAEHAPRSIGVTR
jgi:hypothetical protein